MPSIHVLIVVVGLLLGRDLARQEAGVSEPQAWQFLLVSGWSLLVGLLAMAALPACAKAAAYRGSWRTLDRGLALASLMRWLAVMPFAIWAMATDGVGAVTMLIGSWIGLDEALAAAPPLLALLAIAWAEHPLHERMRQAMLMRHLDQGVPIEHPPTRVQATIARARTMLAMPLVPVFLIVCWHETSAMLLSGGPGWLGRTVDLAGTLAIIAMAPALIVRVLGTRPLREGPFHERVMQLGRAMRARISGIRLWANPSANAAILGLLPGARYMLVTEPLLGGMPGHEVDAVVAHELAHVRQHHVLWIVLSLLALIVLLSVVQAVFESAAAAMGQSAALVGGAVFAMGGATAILAFGAISRLIERQADAHAAVTIGLEYARDQGSDPQTVHPGGPACMAAALDRVCALNGIHPERWGFRHGSVRQRQRALASLPGVRIDALPVDRAVRTVRRATVLTLLVLGGALLLGIGQGWIRW